MVIVYCSSAYYAVILLMSITFVSTTVSSACDNELSATAVSGNDGALKNQEKTRVEFTDVNGDRDVELGLGDGDGDGDGDRVGDGDGDRVGDGDGD